MSEDWFRRVERGISQDCLVPIGATPSLIEYLEARNAVAIRTRSCIVKDHGFVQKG